MKRFFQFPELLLLLMLLPLGGMGSFPLSFMVLISWVFHVVLRYKYPAHYPAFGSWLHVVLSMLCWATMMFIINQLVPGSESGKFDPLAFINIMIWGTAGGFLALLFTGMQIFFWLVALYSLDKRGKKRRPLNCGGRNR